MSGQFFSLEPDKSLCDFIDHCKSIARDLCGEQKYLQDSPHLTLYVADLSYGADLYQELNQANLNLGKMPLNGWTKFMNDPVTGGHTLVLEVAQGGIEELRNLQFEIIQIALRYKKDDVLARYRNAPNLNAVMRENLEKYGFPFVGDMWRAHFTIASFEKDVFTEAWQQLGKLAPPTTTRINKLVLQAIQPDCVELLKEWSVKAND